MEEVLKKYLSFENLNNTWVITKRHNGNVFFKRKNLITCVKNQPTKDCLYYDENTVIEQVNKLNSSRKKCKYGYENASKYFVNNYKLSTWGDLKITNIPIPIKSVTADTKLKSLESCISELKARLRENVEYCNKRIQDYKEELPKRIKDLTENYNKYISENSQTVISTNCDLANLSNVNTNDYVAAFETQGDKIVKVLYGKKEEKTNTDNNEAPF